MENDPLPPASRSENSELKAQYDGLQSTLFGLLLVMIFLAGTFGVFMWRQAAYAQGDLNMVYMGYTNAMAQYERTRPIIDETVAKLQQYGRTNPDFMPILAKYNLLPGAASSGTSQGTAKAPGKK